MSAPVSDQSALDLTVAVTCYNEEAFITNTLETVVRAAREAGLKFEVIVIDDVSSDNSVACIRNYLGKHPGEPITLVENKTNQGIGRNFMTGARMGRGTYYRLFPGDDNELQYAMVHIFRHVGCADLILPAVSQDKVANRSAFRRRLSKTFTFIINLISGFQLVYYNGLPIYRRENVLKWPPVTPGFGFQADIITRHLYEGVSYIQVPVVGFAEKKGEASTALTWKNVCSVIHACVLILGRRLRRAWRRPCPQPRAVILPCPIEQIVPGK